MEAKIENLAVVREMLRTSENPAQIVDVRLIDRPYVH
jgi:hypothetical protein